MRLVPGAQRAHASSPACPTHRGHARLEPNKHPVLPPAHSERREHACPERPSPSSSTSRSSSRVGHVRQTQERTRTGPTKSDEKATKDKINKEAAPGKTKPHADACASSDPTGRRRRRRLEGGVHPAPATPTPMDSSPTHSTRSGAQRDSDFGLKPTPPARQLGFGLDTTRTRTRGSCSAPILRTHAPGLARARQVIERQG
jgi:hypothetical protein